MIHPLSDCQAQVPESTNIWQFCVVLPQAHIIRYRFDAETVKRMHETRWWDREESELQKIADHFYDVEGFLSE